MTPLLRALPWLVLFLAAIDTLGTRLALPWRVVEPSLYVQSIGLWGVFGVLPIVPALFVTRLWNRLRPSPDRDRTPVRATIALIVFLVLPVVVHGTLDRYTGLLGSLTALGRVRPWIELAAALLVTGLLLYGLTRLLTRFPLRPVARVTGLVALSIGLFLPWRSSATAKGPAADRPNVLVLVWDTCRSDRLEPYGWERPTTPNLQRFSQEAYVFENSVSASCFTLSSHLSLLTGLRPSSHGGRFLRSRFDGELTPTMAEILRRAGYRTAAFVGTDVLSGDSGIHAGFEVYDDEVDPPVTETRAWAIVHDVQSLLARVIPALRNNGRPHWIQDFQRPAGPILERAAEWIQSDDERPWFCFINLYDVHWPYVPLEGHGLVQPYDGPVDGFLFRSDAWREGYEMTPADRRHVEELYQAEIRDLDKIVDEFLAVLHLEEGGTAVAVTSDHGEAFGEGGRWKHEDITEPQVRVPLLIRRPEPAPAGARVLGPVSGIDLAPTLLGLAQVELPVGIEGVDLLAGDVPAERIVMVEDRDHADPRDVRIALYSGSWKLVRWGLEEDVRFELYDLRADPVGEEDVSAGHPEVLEELTAALTELRARGDAADSRPLLDATADLDALNALGYGGR